MQSSLRISKPVLFLGVFVVVAQFVYGVHAARTGYSINFIFWYSLAFSWAVGWWFIKDSQQRDITWADDYFDLGMLLYFAWFFLIPYYLFKTRGWKAIYTIGLLLGAHFGAYVTGVILYSLFSLF